MTILEIYKKHKNSKQEVFMQGADHNTYIIDEFGNMYRIFKDSTINEICLQDIEVGSHFLNMTAVELKGNPFEANDNVVCMLDYISRNPREGSVFHRWSVKNKMVNFYGKGELK